MPDARVAVDVLESLLEGCQVIGFDWRYLYVNERAASQGRRPKEELLGRTMQECYPGIDQTPMFGFLRRCMLERIRDRMENEFRYPDGESGWFELRFIPVPEGACILSIDITEAKRAEQRASRLDQQLRQMEKMEAIGQLAGGIAHDFNNLLSVIIGYADLASKRLAPGEPLRADIDEIQTAGRRAAELTRQLLAFSRQQVLERSAVDVDRTLRSIEGLLRRVLRADVRLTILPASEPCVVWADSTQLEQVLLNLAINASDAMPLGGQLTIATKHVELDEEYAKDHHEVRPGPYVLLSVSDNGVGMDRETQARIFEPFFTTKEKGRGTGLGLATVFGIVRQSNGHIWVYSEPGAGTVFKIYLPRVEQSEDAPRTTSELESLNGTETILLVDDDTQVKGVARAILERRGYTVLAAANGGEALLLAEQHPGEIHLLLSDAVMPFMSGQQLAERLAPLRPAMRVLFMSGYTDDGMLLHGVLESVVASIQKPLMPDALARKIRKVLDATD
ncbi:MAG: response regulator [Sandaracinaceae bacterium]|nr:response regulator [Sandaracinaceae bacterium]